MQVLNHWMSCMLATLLITGALWAADDEEKEEEKAETLDAVVVTATKTDRTVDKVANSVTVIMKDEIKDKGHATVAEILVGQPGIDLVRNGIPGTSTSIFMRGADSKNVLLLVDGIPYNDPSNANRNAGFANLTASNIERIEILRGPQSVLYGSNATAGVINVITKDGEGEPSVTLKSEAGSFKTFKNGVSSSGRVNRLAYSVSVDFLEMEGYSIANDNNNDIPHAGNTDEKDGYRSITYSAKLKYYITDDFDISLTGRHTESVADLDASANGYTGDEFGPWPTYAPRPNGQHKQAIDSEESAIRIDLHNSIADGLFDFRFYASHTDLDRQGFDADGNRSFDFVGKTEQYGWQGDWNTAHNTLSIGGDLYREFAYTESSNIDENADTRSGWFQNQVEFGGFYAVAGARHDRHDRFGEHSTWRVAPAYTLASKTKFKASYSTGFRAPSLFELYSSFGNQNLMPEESKGWDAGIEQSIGDAVTFGATYFFTEYYDMIGFNFSTSAYDQIDGDTETQGVEAFMNLKASDELSFLFNYTYTDTEQNDGTRLTRRPLNKAMLTTNYKFLKNAGVNVDIQYVGERDASPFAADKNGNSVDSLDEYVLVNLSMYYKPVDNLKLYARIDNVTDEFYETAWSYAMPERSYYVGFELTF